MHVQLKNQSKRPKKEEKTKKEEQAGSSRNLQVNQQTQRPKKEKTLSENMEEQRWEKKTIRGANDK